MSLSSNDTYTHDVMLSYCWAQKDTVLRIRDALVGRNFTVWLDENEMVGDIYEKMQEAIRNSAVIVVCLSSQYEQSANCTREIKYAADVRKPIVPVRLDAGPFRFSAFITAGAIYVDLEDNSTADWANRMDILAKNIRHCFKEKFTYGKLYHTLYQPDSLSTKKYSVEMEMQKINNLDSLSATVLSRDVDGIYNFYTLEQQPLQYPKNSDFLPISVEGISHVGGDRLTLVLKSRLAILLKLNNESQEKIMAIERFRRYEDMEATAVVLQSGKIDLRFTVGSLRWNEDQWETKMCKTPVLFSAPFKDIPTIATSVYLLDSASTKNTRVYVQARDVTKLGFTAAAHVWGDSETYAVGITWVAYTGSG
ncbi:cytokinesis protein 3 [Nowakowskiella sp. JEL0407]|nr:cytokinesis protein 3 [Nowakowskiella sp. JEL0407]